MKVHFVLVAEGTSDHALVDHLRTLCVLSGADEASGLAPDWGRVKLSQPVRMKSMIDAAIELEPSADFLFIHRDSDSRDADQRRHEIKDLMADRVSAYVAVVPVQETEAWILLDENEIRAVAGNPNGRTALDCPRPMDVERLASPKEILEGMLATASGYSGRRLRKFRGEFPNHRRLLLERLDSNGPVADVPAHARLRRDIVALLATIPEPPLR